jgi:hypothetical protein
MVTSILGEATFGQANERDCQNRIFAVHDRIFGDSPAKYTVYKPYICGSDRPYKWTVSSARSLTQSP